MKTLLMKRLLLAGIVLTCTAVNAATINFTSPIPSTGTFSNSSPWPTNGTFDFEIGVFNAGFTPTASNVDSWLSNWNIANMAGQPGATEWVDDGGDTGFTGSGGYTTNSGPWAIGSRLYIWGFNSRSIGSNQWILLENATSWVTIDQSTLAPQAFNTNQSGTAAVVGSLSGGGSTFQSAAVTLVPEPTTWALAALGATSVLVLRRRRQV